MLHSSLMVFFALCHLAHLFSWFLFFALCHLGHLNLAEEENKSNPSCPTFRCGKIDRIKFPFSNYSHPRSCGVLKVDGCQKDVQRIQLDRNGIWYEIDSIDQANTMFIRDGVFQEHLNSNSCETFNNLTFSRLPFLSFQILPNVSLYKCDHPAEYPLGLDLVYSGCSNFRIYQAPVQTKLPTLPPSCSLIQLPSKLNPSNIFWLLNASFSLQVKVSPPCWQCHYRKSGECQVNNEKEFYCANATEGSEGSGTAKICDCSGNQRLNLKIGLGIGVFGPLIAMSTLMSLYFARRRYKQRQDSSNLLQRDSTSSRTDLEGGSVCFGISYSKGRGGKHDVEEFLKSYGTLAPKRFSYSEIKKITKSFREKLGKGGYGEVFKGKLPDGSLVAVKVLTKSKTNGEDFLNEVASIGRTSHVNIVTLLGFCFEGSKRALIYEFMSGGSLEKYIYEESYSNDERQLGWETLLDIAIGIARGLEYLHRGCNTRILHFDIKPHNILLDEKFCPKVSDFGLAKICPQRESIISMVGARGTAGYIAPEVFCRNFGGVSHKSDVYSYGMMVFEMVGGRKNIRVEVENSSEIYFPHWIHKRLELGEDLGLCGTRNVEERQIAKKMILVSLWCIQTNPSDRPAMGRVVEMLQGSLESIPIPPKPYLSSPSGSPQISMSSSPSTSILTGQISEQVIKEVMG